MLNPYEKPKGPCTVTRHYWKDLNVWTVFPPGLKKGGGRIEHLETVYALAHALLACLHYYPVLREHGKKVVLWPFPRLGENTDIE